MMKRLAPLALAFSLAACGSSEPGPGGISANEAEALEDAAEMVESQKLDQSALRPPAQTAPEAAPPAK